MNIRHQRSSSLRVPVAPLHRGPQAAAHAAAGIATPHAAPNAALLIDFDNVTMGIRSDLQTELRNLLSSDIISGKVAVQPLVFNRVMDIAPVSGWQVIQQADDGLVVLLTGVRDGLTDEALIEQLSRSLAQEGARVPYIQVQRVAAIPKTAAGKAPLIKSNVAHNAR